MTNFDLKAGKEQQEQQQQQHTRSMDPRFSRSKIEMSLKLCILKYFLFLQMTILFRSKCNHRNVPGSKLPMFQ